MHASILETPLSRTYEALDQPALEAIAHGMATKDEARDALIVLEGELGAGKTTLARALLRALGVSGRIKSPTFALLESYDLQDFSVAHLDLYRLRDAQEWQSSGLRDTLLEPGLKLIEWPDRAGTLLPLPDLRIHFQVNLGATVSNQDTTPEPHRTLTMTAYTTTGCALLDASSRPVAAAR
jgi:tRNA threonylcarbamoyladenosine biosynthesis protein TsaE